MLKEEVKNTIKKYNLIENGDNIIIGVSGGPDSICLLHVLNELKKELQCNIYVAHVNHMMRTEADEETKYVEEFCEKLGIECFTKKVDIAKISKQNKKGIEETGRSERYKFFDDIGADLASGFKIATAHNLEDKTETILMNILRGSGVSGLKGIEPIKNGKYIRPLIETDRTDIEKYCEENRLKPKYDKSNNDNIYTRNKMRNIVIPYIKEEFNPNIIKTMNRLAEVVTEEDEYLNNITKQIYKELCIEANPIILDLKKFNNLELVLKRRVILYTINELFGTATRNRKNKYR